MNFEEYWYALEYKAALISTNTNFLQPRPEIRYELSVWRWCNVDGFEWVMQKRCTCVNELLDQVDMFTTGQEGGVWYLRLPYLLLRLTAVKCLQAVAPVVWTGGHWSLTFFLNSPELCLIICRPTVVRVTSDISNVADMHAVYCQYQLSTH